MVRNRLYFYYSFNLPVVVVPGAYLRLVIEKTFSSGNSLFESTLLLCGVEDHKGISLGWQRIRKEVG